MTHRICRIKSAWSNSVRKLAGLCLAIFLVEICRSQAASAGVEPSLSTTNKAEEDFPSEYPRPTMVREDWLNLNGEWNYGITSAEAHEPGVFTNQIVVPFPIESSLSRSGRKLFTEHQRIWYRRVFTVPEAWKGRRLLLHFEAADWETRVRVNGKDLGVHQGGYDRFTFDITKALKPGGEQELIVSVVDPTDAGFQPLGKQMLHPQEPFFHPSSGIWQTVWLEPVPDIAVESLKLVPDVDRGELNVNLLLNGETNSVSAEIEAFDGVKSVSRVVGDASQNFRLPIHEVKLWSPDSPSLYDLKVALLHNGKKIDEVTSYFGMRKIAVANDGTGVPRLFLNDKSLFQLGLLDQGYWPDGLYAAPTDAALKYDIEVMKRLGFNLCRKHVKIEPERWYYWCDRLGLLVWQDMPNGDRSASKREQEIKRTPDSARQFEEELRRMIIQHANHPSIVVWIAFNQGWGQYDTARITDQIKTLDPHRLVLSASGWHDRGTGDLLSTHRYSTLLTAPAQDGKRVTVIGECGGFGLIVPGHLWGGVGQWNTTYFDTAEKLLNAYHSLISQIARLKEKDGVSAAVITQLTDVETELNGMMTYDRAVIKMPEEKIRGFNSELFRDRR